VGKAACSRGLQQRWLAEVTSVASGAKDDKSRVSVAMVPPSHQMEIIPGFYK